MWRYRLQPSPCNSFYMRLERARPLRHWLSPPAPSPTLRPPPMARCPAHPCAATRSSSSFAGCSGMTAAEAAVRFRHTLGDVGPFQFPLSSPIGDLKAKLFEAWPTGESLPCPANWCGIPRVLCSGTHMLNQSRLGGRGMRCSCHRRRPPPHCCWVLPLLQRALWRLSGPPRWRRSS